MKKKIFLILCLAVSATAGVIQAAGVSIQDLIDQNKIPPVFDNSLDLNNRSISSLIGLENIPGVQKIKTLWLNGNLLTSLPSNIQGVPNLQKLFVNKNQITSLPINREGVLNIEGLENLLLLNLVNNRITTLPINIELKNLRQLWLSGNPIQPKKVDNITISAQEQINQLQNKINTSRTANTQFQIVY